ncbi:hypothetical protein LZG00_05565 [Rhodobacteraceae bacterium LMO-12]|nr:hypothetical protein [Rhodobacteraceae bacterium LMO-JJ12]
MSKNRSETEEVLRRAEEVLFAAEAGLSDLESTNARTRNLGLRNLIVFGRSVTFVIQNLRGKEPEFDEWYAVKQSEMKEDPAFKFFLEARNKLEKQGKLGVSSSCQIRALTPETMKNVEKQPPWADGFVIGDRLGGTGWTKKLPNGDELTYYVDLPTEIGKVEQRFMDFEGYLKDGLSEKTVDELSRHYVEKLAEILDSARSRFLKEDASQRLKGKRLPSYIRIVK